MTIASNSPRRPGFTLAESLIALAALAAATVLVAQFVLLLDHGFHLCFCFGLATLQGPNMLQNTAPDPLVLRRSQPVLLRDHHTGDIVAVGGKVRQTLAFGRVRWGWNQLERSSHLAQDLCINAIALGQTSCCASKFSGLPRVHACRMSPGFG